MAIEIPSCQASREGPCKAGWHLRQGVKVFVAAPAAPLTRPCGMIGPFILSCLLLGAAAVEQASASANRGPHSHRLLRHPVSHFRIASAPCLCARSACRPPSPPASWRRHRCCLPHSPPSTPQRCRMATARSFTTTSWRHSARRPSLSAARTGITTSSPQVRCLDPPAIPRQAGPAGTWTVGAGEGDISTALRRRSRRRLQSIPRLYAKSPGAWRHHAPAPLCPAMCR